MGNSLTKLQVRIGGRDHSEVMDRSKLFEFLQVIQASPSIQEKLKAASDAEAIAIAEIAKEAGFDIPLEELKVRGRWWENLP